MVWKPLAKSISMSLLCNKLGKISIRPFSFSQKCNSHHNISSSELSKQPTINGAIASGSYTCVPWLSSRFPVNGGINTPFNPFTRLPIGIPLSHRILPVYEDPSGTTGKVFEDPLTPFLDKIIEEGPSSVNNIEKQAARLIVIRRIKMNKHKLKKLRKKMKFVWAKVKHRRALRKEKAYLNAKMDQIREARSFDAKQFVADVIRRAKEVPLERRWTDPLMPEWYKEQEIQKEANHKRYQRAVNLHLNKSIKVEK